MTKENECRLPINSPSENWKTFWDREELNIARNTFLRTLFADNLEEVTSTSYIQNITINYIPVVMPAASLTSPRESGHCFFIEINYCNNTCETHDNFFKREKTQIQ